MARTTVIRSKTSVKKTTETKSQDKPVEYNWGKGNKLGTK